MKSRYYDIASITIIAAACGIVMYRQLVTPAVFTAVPDDTVIYLNWTRQFAESFREGVLYPRWMHESNGGFGSPTFMFYQPFVIYLTSLLDLAVKDPGFSLALVKLIGLFLSGLSMYIFAKDLWGKKAGLAAAVVYLILPSRVFDEYFLTRYGARYAFVWFPLVLYFARKAVKDDAAWRNFAALALCYGLLCITHLLYAYMFTPVLFAFGLISAGRGRLGRSLLTLTLASLLGLCLSAFYTLPVLAETPLAHLEMLVVQVNLQYPYNFLFNFFGVPYNLNRGFLNFTGQAVIMSCLFGISVYLLSVPFKGAGTSRYSNFFLAVVILTIFLMSSLSAFIWGIPGFKMLQFPDRWAHILVLSLACLAGSAVRSIQEQKLSSRKTFISFRGLLFIICAAASLIYNLNLIDKSSTLSRHELAGYRKDLDVTEYVPRTVSLDWLENELKNPSAEKVVPMSGSPVSIHIEKWDAVEREFEVSGSRDAPLRIRTFYYPGWRGFVDGKAVELSSEKDTGAILMNVPEGRHKVSLTFSDTPDRIWGKVLSAVAAAFILYVLVRSRKDPAVTDGNIPGQIS